MERFADRLIEGMWHGRTTRSPMNVITFVRAQLDLLSTVLGAGPHPSSPERPSGRLTGSVPVAVDHVRLSQLLLLCWMSIALIAPCTTQAQVTITRSIAASSDDAEEEGPTGTNPGEIHLNSSDIELVNDFDAPTYGVQKVGLRFTSMTIPAGATITDAYLRHRAVNADSPMENNDPTSLTIRGQLTPNPPTFPNTDYDISGRPLTAASVGWAPPSWSVGNDYDSPSLVPVIQELVDQGGWASGNAIVLIITGSGHRASQAYDSDPAAAARLVITYTTFAIEGTVFEDLHYGGGAGRDKTWAINAGGSGRPNARVELYDGSGNFSTFTNTNASGDYSFSGLVPGNYTVRVVNGSVSSARPGYVAGTHLAVQTFRTDASSGSAVAITDHVGGEVPDKADAGNGSTTLSALSNASTTAQSITNVTIGSADITGLDFGFNFDVIVNTRNSGQGSLRQFMTNAIALGGEASLVQSGSRMSLGTVQPLPAGKESSIFMIADGASHPGLNTGYANLLTGGVAVITPATAFPTITGANGDSTIVDGSTQTANVGNTNNNTLGTGGTVGVDALPLVQLSGPEVELVGVNSITGLNAIGTDIGFRGICVHSFDTDIALGTGTAYLVEENVLGSGPNAFAAAVPTTLNFNVAIGNSARTGTIRNNLIGFSTSHRVYGTFRTQLNVNWTISGNEGAGLGTAAVIAFNSNGPNAVCTGVISITGNLIYGGGPAGISCDLDYTALPSGLMVKLIENNTIRNNNTFGLQIIQGDGSNTVRRNIIRNNGHGILVDQRNGAATRNNRITENSIYDNGMGIDLDLGAPFPTVTPNNGVKLAGADNQEMDYPIVTQAVLIGGTLHVTGYVGNAPGQSDFANSIIEFFEADADGNENGAILLGDGLNVPHGEGRTYLGTLLADANGNFSGSFATTGLSVGEIITTTATDPLNNTSEFSNNVVVAPPGSIAGTVFEDVNYGGGAGRNKATAIGAGGTGRPNARVELYDGSGAYDTFATTDASGNYSFADLLPGNYTVRVVNSTVSSARPGYVPGLLPVQTFRTNANTGTALAVADHVGGEVPGKSDAGNGTTTLASLTTVSSTAQSITSVAANSTDVTGVDFGFNFDVIVNTNVTGQGSLAQFINNANALAGDATLAQSGSRSNLGATEALPAGRESSIFMIANGTAQPGLNTGYADLLTGGVAVIAPTSLPVLTGSLTNVDGTTQTVNVGNTNPILLGAGGTVGVDALALAQVPAPEVWVNMSAAGSTGLDLRADQQSVRGLAVSGAFAGNNISLPATATNSVIEQNVVGSSATAFTDPGAALRAVQNIGSAGATNVIVRNNLVGFASQTGIYMPPGTNGWQVIGNEVLDNGISWTNGDNIAINTVTGVTVRGNSIKGAPTQGIVINTVTNATFENNTISGNGVGNGIAQDQSPGITVRTGCSAVSFVRNVITANYGAGIQVNPGSSGITLTRNAIADNGTILARSGAAPTGQIGIDLNNATDDLNFGTAPFYTLSDAGDGDTGGNDLQNFPTLNSAASYGGDTYIEGSFNSGPNALYELEFFSSPVADPSGYGEGESYRGSLNVTTDGAGNASINAVLSGVVVPTGQFMTATVTRLTTGSTSEFSNAVVVIDDLDHDNDGIVNTAEAGDCDNDGVPSAYDLDSDNDGIYDVVESGSDAAQTGGVVNGPVNANGIPTAVDTNADGTVEYTLANSDGSGPIDACELDADGDGCSDVVEAGFIDTNGDGTPGQAPITVDGNGLVTSLTP